MGVPVRRFTSARGNLHHATRGTEMCFFPGIPTERPPAKARFAPVIRLTTSDEVIDVESII